MTEWVVEAQQTFLESFKVTSNQYTSDWDSRLEKIKQEIILL